MLKILSLLTILVAFTVSRPTDDIPDLFLFLMNNTPAECIDQTYELAAKLMKTKNDLELKYGNIEMLYNKELMNSLVQKFKTISDSINSPNCSTINFVKYFLDGTVFIGNEIYGEAFACLSEEDLETKFTDCNTGMVPKDSDVLEYLKPVSYCVTHKLECSPEDRKHFISAVYAGADLFETFNNGREVLKKMESNKLTLKFVPEKYDHILN
ncbi:hypothetical protein CRE_14137 [Caenorhabditis remanei]|uniref:Uncharacterized protein n=1 Tax=Caenorhabditis remanei TaxID=31234 RepID=E3MRF5_CAERE|nr:hypothetical protein CRE_14137 [Caenorhabditis remanei]